MAFYDLFKQERMVVVSEISATLKKALFDKDIQPLAVLFANEDTYIRKNAYISIGRLAASGAQLKNKILSFLTELYESDDFKVRQTVINAAGEIGMGDFASVESFMEIGLLDEHHSVRNAVIGSLKKMGHKNPQPVLSFASRYISHPDKEIRREICHGIELRGRTHPQDILPLLELLQHDKTARVANTLIHVLGQIAYKKGCLETVIAALNKWENKSLVAKAIDEIIDVHERYSSFAVLSQEECIKYIAIKYSSQ